MQSSPTDQQIAAFGATVRRLRREREWSQEHLAGLAGIHPTLMPQIERGKDMRLSTAFKLAAGLGMELDELLRLARKSD